MRLIELMRRDYLKRLIWMVADPEDSDDLKLQKSLLVGSSGLVILAGIVWGALYLGFNEPIPASIPFSYSILSLIAFIWFLWSRRYALYRRIQLLLILLLPFFLMITLGGFVNSSAVVLWSVLCPLGALLFTRSNEAVRWMIFYLGLVIIGGILQPFSRETNNLPPSLIVPVFFVLNIGAVTGITFILLNYFVREKNRAYDLLRAEQEKSERLLLNVLPAEIAPRLKAENRTIADYFDSASVLFADIVGSTPLFANMRPDEIIDWLNEVFSMFDRLVEKHGLEKIRTIGDNYMVASGAPTPRSDHAQAIISLALEMCRQVATLPARSGNKIEIRVGVNSGPLVGGVIGETKFHYDLWGDTVNTASRMESHGEPGKVQITADTYELIRQEFVCEARGEVPVKGKGVMETWFVVEKRVLPEGGKTNE